MGWPKNDAMRQAFMRRLKSEGRRSQNDAIRRVCVNDGEIPSTDYWKIGCALLPPVDGTTPEIAGDPAIAEIRYLAEKIKAKCPQFVELASGVKDFTTLDPETVADTKTVIEGAKKAAKNWAGLWGELSKQVEIENADLVAEVLWVVAHRFTDVKDIDPATVPSKAAVSKLSLVQESSAQFAEFLRTFESKLIPERKQLEYASRITDDGSEDVAEVDEFLVSFKEDVA